MVLRGKSLMNYMVTKRRSEASSSRHQHGWVQCVWYDGSPIQLLARICLSTQSPPGQIMQRKNIFLTLIIPGPNYPGKNMNVYMQPLKDELQEAWDNGFKTYDAYRKRNFIMRVWYMYSTHDLPAYALFVGWCVHGRFPCPTCKGDRKSVV